MSAGRDVISRRHKDPLQAILACICEEQGANSVGDTRVDRRGGQLERARAREAGGGARRGSYNIAGEGGERGGRARKSVSDVLRHLRLHG